jgi:ketosteroid isomerase-like protein
VDPAVLERIRLSYVVYNDGPGVLRGEHDDFYAALFHADAELIVPQSYPDMEPVYVGIDGLKRQRARMEEIWEDLRWDPERFIEAGELVVVLLTLSGISRQMKAGVSAPVAHVWTVRGDRVARVEVFLDRGEAFAAAGLAENGLP